ncbi:spore coat protein [Mesobacillus harenae]|uniref:spore coat protein n=1 Tax=Mesobacillus harenae TaxID=2213203 RepID=UPI00157FDA55|nr:spore coat protein [Mesobacillus harenae]
MANKKTLAWHETLELHELVAFQSFVLMKLKKSLGEIQDPDLHSLYTFSIQALENNLRELLKFYPAAPGFDGGQRADTAFFAGDLLAVAKTAVRNYAIAITETATPALRAVLKKQLNSAVDWHARVYTFMYNRGLYPSYDINQLLMNDLKIAQKALKG